MNVSRRRRAFTLTEVIAALGIVGFGLVSLLALVTLGVETNRISAEESGAMNLATSILSDLRNTPVRDADGNLTTESARFNLPMPLTLDTETEHPAFVVDVDGKEPTATSTMRYQVRLTYTPAGTYNAVPDFAPAFVSLRIIWPATASEADAVHGSWESVASFPVEVAAWR